MNSVILTSAYLAPVQYYTKLYAAPRIVEERCDHYVKQTYRNRCIIAAPDGPLPLVVPVERDDRPKRPTRDVRLSNHGQWRRLHRAAFVSAYENSPFFEYYADEFFGVLERPYAFLVDLNEAFRSLMLDWLDLHPRIEQTESYMEDVPPGTDDLRERIRPKIPASADPAFRPAPYYQVFAGRNGFLPNLSIADLLFNMGPESRMVLRASCLLSS